MDLWLGAHLTLETIHSRQPQLEWTRFGGFKPTFGLPLEYLILDENGHFFFLMNEVVLYGGCWASHWLQVLKEGFWSSVGDCTGAF